MFRSVVKIARKIESMVCYERTMVFKGSAEETFPLAGRRGPAVCEPVDESRIACGVHLGIGLHGGV